jgi:hypothetical protein
MSSWWACISSCWLTDRMSILWHVAYACLQQRRKRPLALPQPGQAAAQVSVISVQIALHAPTCTRRQDGSAHQTVVSSLAAARNSSTRSSSRKNGFFPEGRVRSRVGRMSGWRGRIDVCIDV